jgi:hypothetical protein
VLGSASRVASSASGKFAREQIAQYVGDDATLEGGDPGRSASTSASTLRSSARHLPYCVPLDPASMTPEYGECWECFTSETGTLALGSVPTRLQGVEPL